MQCVRCADVTDPLSAGPSVRRVLGDLFLYIDDCFATDVKHHDDLFNMVELTVFDTCARHRESESVRIKQSMAANILIPVLSGLKTPQAETALLALPPCRIVANQ